MILEELVTNTRNDYIAISDPWSDSILATYGNYIATEFEIMLKSYRNENINLADLASTVQQFVNAVRRRTDSENIGEFFIAIRSIGSILETHAPKSFLGEMAFSSIKDEISQLWETFNSLIRSPNSYDLILAVFFRLQKIGEEIKKFEKQLNLLDATSIVLCQINNSDSQKEPLIIHIRNTDLELSDFSKRLLAIAELYDLVSDFFENVERLDIIRIESGSLFAKLQGDKRVIGFIEWILKNGIKFLHRNFTKEGKFEKLAQQQELLDKQISLTNRMKSIMGEAEYEIFRNKNSELIAKNIVLISKSTMKIIGGVAGIRIQDEEINLSDENSKKFLENSKSVFIEGAS